MLPVWQLRQRPQVPLAAYPLANVQALYARAQLCHLAYIFMADRHGGPDVLGGPGVPIVDMYVCAANCGFVHFDEHLPGAGLGDGHLAEFQAGARGGLYKRIHELWHVVLL